MATKFIISVATSVAMLTATSTGAFAWDNILKKLNHQQQHQTQGQHQNQQQKTVNNNNSRSKASAKSNSASHSRSRATGGAASSSSSGGGASIGDSVGLAFSYGSPAEECAKVDGALGIQVTSESMNCEARKRAELLAHLYGPDEALIYLAGQDPAMCIIAERKGLVRCDFSRNNPLRQTRPSRLRYADQE